MSDYDFLLDRISILNKQLLETVRLAQEATVSRVMLNDRIDTLSERIERLEIENRNLRHRFETRRF